MTPGTLTQKQMIDLARSVLVAERDAIDGLIDKLDKRFARAARLVHACTGNVIVTGMGKAYLVGQKLSATLASTGTPSLTLHPADALHGDLGRVRPGDVVLVLSNAGETEEVVRLLEPLKALGATLVAMTGAPDSTVARAAEVVLDINEITEACPHGLAPTASTTAMLALGDALALTVLQMRNFTANDFARYHPAGSLGRKLLTVDEVMRSDKRLVTVRPGWTVRRMLKTMSGGTYRTGAALVTDGKGKLRGIFTDGDLRRWAARGEADLVEKTVGEVMIENPKHVVSGQPAHEAARLMKKHQIDEVPVVDDQGRLVGLIDIQDLLSRGF